MNKQVILTGLRANNDLHLGNYLGALLPLIDLARTKAGEYRIHLFVPDLHSFTTPVNHDELQQGIIDNITAYIALGLPVDHSDINVYRQSYISAHSELTWILSCFTRFGEMSRMTQFKDKSAQITNQHLQDESWNESPVGYEASSPKESAHERPSASVGLFSYPILMAADILLYSAQYVPVGDDQTQHLEFTRDVAERMNRKFARELFVVPHETQKQHQFFGKDQGLRIRDLVNPTKKMSKSDETGKGVIFLQDSPDEAKRKIMSATTDSFADVQYDYDTRPGISNLLDIYQCMGADPQEFIGNSQYGPLKKAVAERVGEFLSEHQNNRRDVKREDVEALLARSEESVRTVAAERLYAVQQAVGLRPQE